MVGNPVPVAGDEGVLEKGCATTSLLVLKFNPADITKQDDRIAIVQGMSEL
jgi:hypothetical protein